MSKIKDENYFQVSGWMINRLQLKGNELMVYAIIYGFTQAENQQYTGSRKYLADFIGCSVGTVDNCLASLVDKGLLEKSETITNSIKFCAYRAIYDTTTNFVAPRHKNCSTPPTTNFVPNNKESNIDSYKNNNPPYISPNDNLKEIKAELKQRINVLFHRRENTTWTAKENALLQQVAKRNSVLDEMTEIETLYNSDYAYGRRSVPTFLNNWATELDRARNQKQVSTQQQKYDRTTREVNYEPSF